MEEDERTPLLWTNHCQSHHQKLRAAEIKNGDDLVTVEDGYGISNRVCRMSEFKRLNCNSKDELQRFKIALFSLGLQQSSPTIVFYSWVLFLLFTILVPLLNYSLVTCGDCKYEQICPFAKMVQISESSLSAISFFCLSHNVWKHGLQEFLFWDQIEQESRVIQLGYKKELKVRCLSLYMFFPSPLLKWR
eukprot:Gb_01274 [translate_table: standard]